MDQQRFISSHNSSETRCFPSGRGGHCFLLILAWMTVASRGMLENGISSVMHSNISIANEYVSERAVAGNLLSLMSSGAACLTIVVEDTVFDTVLSWVSWMIFAIPKSQICGSPLPIHSQLLFSGWGGNAGLYLWRDEHIFLRAFSQYQNRECH